MTRRRAVLFLWLLIMAWTSAVYLRAALQPPAGHVFAGTFHWVDDVYNYASFAQQAEDGAFFFRNKLLDPSVTRADVVNLEWWLLGRVSIALGRRPFLAYRLISAVATLLLLAGAARWLARVGVKDSHCPAALALVFFGGGLGGLLFELTDLPGRRCLDLSMGVFPFLEVLANPHWVAATALLVWALWCFTAIPAPRGPLLGAALGTVLGLVRPFDAALLCGIEGLAVVLSAAPPREWPRRWLPLLPVGLVLAYNAWVYRATMVSTAHAPGQIAPVGVVDFSPSDLLPALGPALLLASTAWWQRDREGAGYRLRLALWAALALGLVVLRPVPVALQVVVGMGVPLLVLGAGGLSRFAPHWTALAALGLSSSAVVATRIVLTDDPNWFVPRERLAAAVALRDHCRAGDRVLAPPDVGLYVHGLTACSSFLSHSDTPGYAERLAQTRAFYAEAPPAARAAMVERNGLTRLVLPGYAGLRPEGWLGESTTFQAVAQVGQGPGLITIYARPRAETPAPGRARDERLR